MHIVTNTYGPVHGVGGPQGYVPLFIDAMRAYGHQMTSCVVRNVMSAEIYEPAAKDATYSPEKTDLASIQQAQHEMVDVIRKQHPDVVILNGFSFDNWLLFSAARTLKIPCIVSHHGFWYQEIPAHYPPATHHRWQQMERASIRDATYNVYLNSWSQREMQRQYPDVVRTDDVIIPLAYNPIFLKEPSPFIKADRSQIGFVGRWDPIKNIELIRQFAQEHPEYTITSPIKLTVRKSLLQEVEPFRSIIQIIPPKDPDGLRLFYSAMRAFILPSRFDVNPTVVMEAALQGRATVITATVGWTDLYHTHGMDAFIVEPTVDGLATAVAHAVTTPIPESFVKTIRTTCHPDHVFSLWNDLLHTL